MKLYDVVITEDMLIKGVKALSLVADPATSNDWIELAKDVEIQLAEVNKEKRILMGVVLEPDKPIFRKGTPEDFYIQFSKETIEQAQEYFFSNGFQNASTIEHNKEPLQGNTVVESWIVEDETKDKTALYSLSAPIGSWVVKMKVNNEEVWNDYVKTGKVKGFSIEGFFKPVEITEMSKQLSAEETVQKIKDIIFNNVS